MAYRDARNVCDKMKSRLIKKREGQPNTPTDFFVSRLPRNQIRTYYAAEACSAAASRGLERYRDDMVYNVGFRKFNNAHIRNYASDAKDRLAKACKKRPIDTYHPYFFSKRHYNTCLGAGNYAIDRMSKCLRSLRDPVVY